MRTLRWIVVAVLALGLVGVAQTPRQGGTLVIATGADVVTLDPLRMTDVRSSNLLMHVAESLFTLSPEGTVVPCWQPGLSLPRMG